MMVYGILVGVFYIVNLIGACMFIWLSAKVESRQGYRGIIKGEDIEEHGRIVTKL